MILAIDQGTTGTTCLVFDREGRVRGRAYSEFAPALPAPGLGRARRERDLGGDEARRLACARRREGRPGEPRRDRDHQPARDGRRLGPATGEPVHNALVWQDRRTAARCDELREAGHEPLVRERTGLVLDPYFSGTKIEWLLRNVEAARDAVFGTIDSWLVFKLTGRHATDVTNASRTMLFDIRERRWDPELCGLLGVDPDRLPEPLPSAHVYGTTSEFGGEVPVAGIAGDQQAALFGQACQRPGMAKNTYGTGSFVLLNAGERMPEPSEGLLTTIAWGLGERDHLRARGGDLRHRRRGAMAARRARDRRRGGRDRGHGGLARVQRRRLLRPGADRPRLAPLGPLRARDDRRPDQGDDPRPPRPGGARGDRLPDGRRRPRPGARSPASSSASCAPTAARSPTAG